MTNLLFFFLFSFSSYILGSKPTPWQIGFQEPHAPLMEEIDNVHYLMLVVLSIIGIVVTTLLVIVIYKYRESKNPVASTFSHNTPLEIVWTLVPILVLVVILIPSIKILYVFDRAENPDITIKVTGHQWYWSYDYLLEDENKKLSFDSYMIKEKDLKPGQLRLLDVDEPLVLPTSKTVRVLVTSQDVIHSFAVPSLGIKTDGIPGRINETWLRVQKEGMYYGQCSELCGKDHGFMPIAIKIVSQEEYDQWLNSRVKTEN